MAPATTDTEHCKVWTLEYPELGTGPVPVEPCISQEYFNLERERIFRRVWLNVGRVEEIPNPGDYVVKDIPMTNSSVVVVRGKDGTIRAFHNVCAHRGNKLVWDAKGACRAFACKFHGWTYDLEGKLKGVPDEENFFDFQRSEHGLPPVAADTWEGFIFINLNARPEETLEEYLGEIGKQLHGYPFNQIPFSFGYKAEVKTNWKVIMDAFQEAYHVKFIHKRSVADVFSSRENPLCHPLAFKLYERHRMYSVFGNPEYKPSPVGIVAHRLGSVLTHGAVEHSRQPPGVNPTKAANWGFDANKIFPNFFVDLLKDWYFTYNFWPIAVDRTLFEVRVYQAQAQSAGQKFSQEYTRCVFRDSLLEDLSTMEHTQSALASGAISHFVLQDLEVHVRHSHKVIEDHVGFYKRNGKEHEEVSHAR